MALHVLIQGDRAQRRPRVNKVPYTIEVNHTAPRGVVTIAEVAQVEVPPQLLGPVLEERVRYHHQRCRLMGG